MKIDISQLKPHPLNVIFGNLPRGEFEALKSDIKKRGVQTPIDITEDNIIVCGHQRTKACNDLGIKQIDVRVLSNWNDNQVKEHLIKDNILRRQLTPQQIVDAGKELDKIYSGRHGGARGTGVHLENEGSSRDLIAKDFGISGRTYDRYKKAAEIIEERNDDELKAKWVRNKVKASRIIREAKIEEQIKQIEIGTEKLIGRYDVIVIDPPWNYANSYDPDGQRGTTPYPQISTEDLKKIELPANDNCILWLWVTNSFMRDAFILLDAWGFEPKTILSWDKVVLGVGRWLRNVTEHCILAIKGKPIWNNRVYSTLISEKRTEHSKKPTAFYKMVNEICYGRKLDYFAREKREGWDVFGDEIRGGG